MTIRSIAAFLRHCHGHSLASQDPGFRQKRNFFERGENIFSQQLPSQRQPIVTAAPDSVRNITDTFEKGVTGQNSQALQRKTENRSQMFWCTSTQSPLSAPQLEPLLTELSSSKDAHPPSEKADKGKGKVIASESIEEQESTNDALIRQLKGLCSQLNAKDDDDQYKRVKGHYLALEGQQLVWKPFHKKEGKLQCEERAEAKKALLHLLDVLEQAAQGGVKEIYDSEEADEIGLHEILEKIINREWGKSLLTDKVVQKKYIDVMYLILFKGNLDKAHEIDSCLREADPALDVIIRILGSIQFKSVTKAMPDIYEKGLHQVGHLRIKEQSRSFKTVLEKVRSSVIEEKMKQEFKGRLERYKSHQIHQAGLRSLGDLERRDLFSSLGMEKIYDDFLPDQHELYLHDLILRYPDRITVSNGRSLIGISESLRELQQALHEGLDLHRKWAEDPKKDLKKFAAETLTGTSKVDAQKAVANNNFGDALTEIFGVGNKIGHVRDVLPGSLLEVFRRAFSYLKSHLDESQLAYYKDKEKLFQGSVNWQEVGLLFIHLRRDMETHGLG